MAIANVELTNECFPKQWRMGIARIKQDKETEEGKRGVSIESKAVTKK